MMIFKYRISRLIGKTLKKSIRLREIVKNKKESRFESFLFNLSFAVI